MRVASAMTLLLMSGLAQAQTQSPNQVMIVDAPVVSQATTYSTPLMTEASSDRGLFQSDQDFPTFIGPISSPILSKDPRSLTEFRPLFISNWIPQGNALGGGNYQVYAGQLRVALTDRLTFIADKDGYASLHPGALSSRSGWLDLAAGFKYTLWRDVENQSLGTVGFMYEAPSGEAKVFSHNGSGIWTVFGVFGQQFGDNWHLLVNQAFQFGQNSRDNTSFFFTQIHIDKQILGCLYPLAELNWYQYTSSGNHGIPAGVGEGDGLLNLGTSGMTGKDLLTAALGLKAKVNCNFEVGVAWETPLSSRKDLISQRVLAEMIFRY